jgi:DNA invertase Pin-like site-specific DNA recombinase
MELLGVCLVFVLRIWLPGSLAEMERELAIERTRAGLEVAR